MLKHLTLFPLLGSVFLAACQAPPAGESLPVFADGPTPHTRKSGLGTVSGASVGDLAFLVGRWQGEGLGGVVEEIWGPPLGGEMIGSFRLVQGGEPVFYELMTLVEEEGDVLLRLKHFDPDLVGWEEREESVSFPLIEVQGTTAWFGGLTLHREADQLLILLAMRRGDTVDEMTLRFDRVGG